MQRFQKDTTELQAICGTKDHVDRRTLLRAAAVLGLAPGLMLGSTKARAAASELVLCDWGGDGMTAIQASAGKSFTATTGVPVKVDGSGPTEGAVRKMHEAGKIVWDLTDGEAFSSETLGAEGLYLPIDYTKVDPEKITKGFNYKYFATTYFYANVIAYDSSKFGGGGPKTWAEFFDVKAFPGKRGFYKWMVGVLEAALMADGVAMADVYKVLATPEGEDRALAKIAAFKPNVAAFWASGSESQQMLRDGDVTANFMWNTRMAIVDKESSGQLTFTHNQAILCPGGWSVLKGGPAGVDNATKFIIEAQKVENQVALFKSVYGAPSNPKASAALSPEDAKYNCAAPEVLGMELPQDVKWYAANYARVLEKYLAMIAA